MEEILEHYTGEAEQRERLQKPCTALRSATESFVRKLQTGEEAAVESVQACFDALLEVLGSGCPAWLRTSGFAASCISSFVGARCLETFFKTGRLKSKASFGTVTTNEYLIGVLRFADEMETYAIGRAMWQDIASVRLCCAMTQSLQQVFMNFNFRNGPLRQFYDTLKYRVKRLENIMYELTLVKARSDGQGDGGGEKASGGAGERPMPSVAELLTQEEFDAMVKELDQHTEERDKVIKAARDPQRDSKKAIFALHRNAMSDARKLMDSCVTVFKATSTTTSLPREELHAGAFGNALEEFAEARIFEEWLNTKGNLLSFEQLRSIVDITEKGYLGGLVDFTGEIGRYGVAKATQRDVDAVKLVLATMLTVEEFARGLGKSMSGKSSKKLDAVGKNTRKMENTLYELILVTQSNRKTMTLTSTEEEPPFNQRWRASCDIEKGASLAVARAEERRHSSSCFLRVASTACSVKKGGKLKKSAPLADRPAMVINMALLAQLRELDAFPKTLEDFRVRTQSGGIISLAGVVVIGLLVLTQAWSFAWTRQASEDVVVDDTLHERMGIHFDIEFGNLECSRIAVEAVDAVGTVQSMARHAVFKLPLDAAGRAVGLVSKQDGHTGTILTHDELLKHQEEARDSHEVALDEHDDPGAPPEAVVVVPGAKCGTCYVEVGETPGSGDSGGKCCNTCEDVEAVFRNHEYSEWTPSFASQFWQCKRGSQQAAALGPAQGCRVFGSLHVAKAKGSFRFGATRDLVGTAMLRMLFGVDASGFDVSHKIHALWFGDVRPDIGLEELARIDSTFAASVLSKPPLEGVQLEVGESSLAQYHVKVIPTDVVLLDAARSVSIHQYAANEHIRPVTNGMLPTLHFFYDTSPLRIKYFEHARSLSHFLTNVCALVGGVFSIMSVLDAAVHSRKRLSLLT
ncbi:Probable endoplasmic reticulum-Golgi intermediate compartment protein 3 [Durusdinium trenchii]|uniref:Probable endoplasmic reticulum-Golgi intermediate compartment protein 3 n=1 Tax=Durusdinium trenchii TaxID=1381693 RepID=A0ABP0I8Z0_9DINO